MKAQRLWSLTTWIFGAMAAAWSITLAAGWTAAQTTPPVHPLEGLKSQEYWAVYEVLQASGKMDTDTYCISVLLHEPPKEKVLAWKVGKAVFARGGRYFVAEGRDDRGPRGYCGSQGRVVEGAEGCAGADL